MRRPRLELPAIGSRNVARMVQGVRNRHLALADLCLLPLAAILAFVIRLDDQNLREWAEMIGAYALAAPLIMIPIFALVGLYRQLWESASVHEAYLLAVAAIAGGLTEGFVFLAMPDFVHLQDLPRSIPFISTMLTFVAISIPRFAVRVGAQRARLWKRAEQARTGPPQRVLIVGAGETGRLVLRELAANPQTGLDPIGFVDDDPSKQGIYIHGRRVLGKRATVPALVREYRIDQVILAMPSASGATIRETVDICKQADVAVRIIPAVFELLSGRVGVEQIRPVQIEDLLRREPVTINTQQVEALLRGKRVLVTGGGGSIGAELCRQISRCGPAELIVLGHGESSIFAISNELDKIKSTGAIECVIRPVIADVRDRERLQGVFARFRPEIVFHAAAHKHVPLMEANTEDAITNNVLGTRQLVDVAMEAGVTHFVFISSDKAVNPTSVMGATKRAAELIVQQAALRTGSCFVAVRFGNVLASRGSVVPYFQQQIAEGGPVTVTHPDMRRYFMTIPEAVQLVLQAATLGEGGEVFVLDMGQPVRILDLAQDLIRLSGLEPGRDIEIVFTGTRPGEKLFEELFADAEAYTRTAHDKIFVCHNGDSTSQLPPALDQDLNDLILFAQCGDALDIRRLLQKLVPEYEPATAPTVSVKEEKVEVA